MSNVVHLVSENHTCSRCRVSKQRHEFVVNKNRKIGITPDCKECRNSRKRQKSAEIRKIRELAWEAPLRKVCSRCKSEKSRNEFAKANWTRIGITPDCKSCRNERYKDQRGGKLSQRPDKVKRIYGVSYDHIKNTLELQHGLCANRACGKEISLDVPVSPNRAVIDHCHETGEFRAILCSPCNLLLGRVENDENILLGLMEYLKKFKKLNIK